MQDLGVLSSFLKSMPIPLRVLPGRCSACGAFQFHVFVAGAPGKAPASAEHWYIVEPFPEDRARSPL